MWDTTDDKERREALSHSRTMEILGIFCLLCGIYIFSLPNITGKWLIVFEGEPVITTTYCFIMAYKRIRDYNKSIRNN